MEMLLDPSILAGLATLIVLEVVLGIDNLVFIAILADKLPPHQRDKARVLGLSLALIMRLGLLASIAWIVGLTAPVFEVVGKPFSWRDIILIGGGLFLLLKATKEIHERLEGDAAHGPAGPAHAAFWVVITQIIALDAVFSLDSIITAVGMVEELWVMMTAVVIAMVIMLAASKPLTVFVNRHPTVIILCLSFLLLIGCSLVAEGFGFHIPKAYLYAAIGFSILIEMFNQMSSRNRRKALAHVPMRQRAADSIFRLLTPTSASAGGAAPVSDDHGLAPGADAFQPAEQAMIRGVIELADQPVRVLMTSRSDIFWLDADADATINRDRLIESGRTRVLVCRGGLDGMLGMVETREALPALLRGDGDLAALVQRPLVVPDEITALRLIDVLRETGERFAVVVDGHGNIDGIVTSTDIFAAIAGDLAEDEDEGDIVRIDDRTIEVDARITREDLAEAMGHEALMTVGRYSSLGGFLLFEFGRMPDPGETIEREGLSITVQSTRPSRIGRVRVTRIDTALTDGQVQP
ncbi:MAG: transporter associated domain-containing protein [Sphingobium sp.]